MSHLRAAHDMDPAARLNRPASGIRLNIETRSRAFGLPVRETNVDSNMLPKKSANCDSATVCGIVVASHIAPPSGETRERHLIKPATA